MLQIWKLRWICSLLVRNKNVARSFDTIRITLYYPNWILPRCILAHFSAIRLNLSLRKLAARHHVVVALSSLLFPQNLFRDYVARLPYDHGFTSLSFSALQFTYILPAGIKKKIFPPLKAETRCREMCLGISWGKKKKNKNSRRGIFRANLFRPI